MKASQSTHELNLRADEWVEVRSAEEIMATLDASHALGGLPFMPEMLPYCGQRFRVYKSAHKTCDTIETFLIRRMENAVHLADLRCDGAAHGGCQAGCLIFWKEAWLKRVDGPHPNAGSTGPQAEPRPAGTNVAVTALFNGTSRPGVDGGPAQYRCQATEVRNATREVSRGERWDPRFYLKDLTSGNVTLVAFLRFGALAVLNSFLIRWLARRFPELRGSAGDKTPTCNMNLQPGELIRVRPRDEILKTLNPGLRNRGLGFDVEMVPYCENGEYKVLRRVEKIINEKTGQMMTLPNPCIVLDGVVCSGNYSNNRMFCPRAIYPYWREIWLTRVADSDRAGSPS